MIEEHFSMCVPVGFETNFVELSAYYGSKVKIKRKLCKIQRVFFVMSGVFVNPYAAFDQEEVNN